MSHRTPSSSSSFSSHMSTPSSSGSYDKNGQRTTEFTNPRDHHSKHTVPSSPMRGRSRTPQNQDAEDSEGDMTPTSSIQKKFEGSRYRQKSSSQAPPNDEGYSSSSSGQSISTNFAPIRTPRKDVRKKESRGKTYSTSQDRSKKRVKDEGYSSSSSGQSIKTKIITDFAPIRTPRKDVREKTHSTSQDRSEKRVKDEGYSTQGDESAKEPQSEQDTHRRGRRPDSLTSTNSRSAEGYKSKTHRRTSRDSNGYGSYRPVSMDAYGDGSYYLGSMDSYGDGSSYLGSMDSYGDGSSYLGNGSDYSSDASTDSIPNAKKYDRKERVRQNIHSIKNQIDHIKRDIVEITRFYNKGQKEIAKLQGEYDHLKSAAAMKRQRRHSNHQGAKRDCSLAKSNLEAKKRDAEKWGNDLDELEAQLDAKHVELKNAKKSLGRSRGNSFNMYGGTNYYSPRSRGVSTSMYGGSDSSSSLGSRGVSTSMYGGDSDSSSSLGSGGKSTGMHSGRSHHSSERPQGRRVRFFDGKF